MPCFKFIFKVVQFYTFNFIFVTVFIINYECQY